MKKTVGSTDRIIRGVLALGLLIAALVAGISSGWGIVLIILAAVMAVTGSSGYCPIYSATGIDTLGQRHDTAEQRHDAHSH